MSRGWRLFYCLAIVAIAWHGLSAWLVGVHEDALSITVLCVLAILWNLDQLASR